jgi:hypothetical protein
MSIYLIILGPFVLAAVVTVAVHLAAVVTVAVHLATRKRVR